MADTPAKKTAANAPARKAAAQPAKKPPLPEHKADLAALAINQHGVPSYEAWAMTVDELTEKLEALRG